MAHLPLTIYGHPQLKHLTSYIVYSTLIEKYLPLQPNE